MSTRDPRIPEDEARELWRRAAELQAAAEQSAQAGRAVAVQEPSGMSLEQVSAAAEGAGIDPDFVRIVFAERQLPDSRDINRKRLPLLRRLVQYEVEAVEVMRWVQSTPEQALAALREVAGEDLYGLTFESTLGKDPARDAVLVYRIAKREANETFHSDTNWADMRVLLITVRPEAEGTRIRIRAPLYRRTTNLTLTGGFAAFSGFIGSNLAATVTVQIAGGALSVVAGPAIAGAVAGGMVGVAVYRALYKWVMRGGESALQRLLQAIANRAEQPSTE